MLRVEDYSNVAVLIPCLNEEITVGKVVTDFLAALPGAQIFVFDNLSTDKTAEIARAAGATVIRSPIRGKGNVVRHMFRAIDAELYVMADGDDTYPARAAADLIERQRETEADMVVGVRMESAADHSFPLFHRFGNRLVSTLIAKLFSAPVSDVLSGYRVFTRELVKSMPLVSSGFEIETELTLQAASKGFLIVEAPIAYSSRPAGSCSKLNTFTDGMRVLKAIAAIFKDYKPMVFFTLASLVLALCSGAAGAPAIVDYVETSYVVHVPLAILAASLGVLAFLSLTAGFILDTVAKYHREAFEAQRLRAAEVAPVRSKKAHRAFGASRAEARA
jgi:glycosyltransferase involved in cell wall biosynthesis